jgi:hypothetical protein
MAAAGPGCPGPEWVLRLSMIKALAPWIDGVSSAYFVNLSQKAERFNNLPQARRAMTRRS